MEEKSLLADPIRLERDDEPRVLFSEPANDLSLELLFPTFKDNLDAQIASQPNETSAVVVLCCGKRRIVFPGDSSISDWRRVRNRLGGPISADVLSVPHHGATSPDGGGTRIYRGILGTGAARLEMVVFRGCAMQIRRGIRGNKQWA